MAQPQPKIGYIGLRARTARAVVVTIAGGSRAPDAVTRGEIVLATAADSSLFQPYHAVMDLPWERAVASAGKAQCAIEEIAKAALKDLITGLLDAGVATAAVGIVGTPERNLAAIGSPHIRAHAAEGVLFRRVLETAAVANGLRCDLFPERDLESLAASRLGIPVALIRNRLVQFGERLGHPWRADEKAAAIAAWLVAA